MGPAPVGWAEYDWRRSGGRKASFSCPASAGFCRYSAMDALTAAELIALANLLAALVRDIDIISETVERHLKRRLDRLGT